jgi:acylpyruvate hydrolase
MRLTRFVEFGRKIVCVGKNYGSHAIEMGGTVPQKPLIFLKPGMKCNTNDWTLI